MPRSIFFTWPDCLCLKHVKASIAEDLHKKRSFFIWGFSWHSHAQPCIWRTWSSAPASVNVCAQNSVVSRRLGLAVVPLHL